MSPTLCLVHCFTKTKKISLLNVIALSVLDDKEKLSQQGLRSRMGNAVTPSAKTQAIQSLLKKKLISAKVQEMKTHYTLTASGKKLVDEVRKIWEKAQEK